MMISINGSKRQYEFIEARYQSDLMSLAIVDDDGRLNEQIDLKTSDGTNFSYSAGYIVDREGAPVEAIFGLIVARESFDSEKSIDIKGFSVDEAKSFIVSNIERCTSDFSEDQNPVNTWKSVMSSLKK